MENTNKNSADALIEYVTNHKLPRYDVIPNVGLYLDQVVKYINETLKPFHLSITPSMLSNYVKKGYINRPVNKQYNSEQIAYLMFIVVAKQVLSMEHISKLLDLQRATYSIDAAYNYFCTELEYMVKMTFEKYSENEDISKNTSYEKKVLRSVVIAVSHMIYLNYCFENL